MPLNFNFNQFKTIPDGELVTTPDSEPFSDGNNPLVRRQVLVELQRTHWSRTDIIADGQGMFFFTEGMYVLDIEGPEGQTLNRVRELDQVDVVPYDMILKLNYEE